MDLTTVTEIVRPDARDRLPPWRDGNSWLAGGTWLFSAPQAHLHRLIDLDSLGWPALTRTDSGLEIAATCRLADLYAFEAPDDWRAAPLFRQCCDALAASFKIWNMATIGGNLCLALPAGALIALSVALDGVCLIWPREGGAHLVPARDFVTGMGRTVLGSGALLRSITLPGQALIRRTALRQIARNRFGLSAALLIGTRSPEADDFVLTITAATRRPVRIDFASMPSEADLRAALEQAIDPSLYFDDANGTTEYRRQMSLYFAEEIRRELAA